MGKFARELLTSGYCCRRPICQLADDNVCKARLLYGNGAGWGAGGLWGWRFRGGKASCEVADMLCGCRMKISFDRVALCSVLGDFFKIKFIWFDWFLKILNNEMLVNWCTVSPFITWNLSWRCREVFFVYMGMLWMSVFYCSIFAVEQDNFRCHDCMVFWENLLWYNHIIFMYV